MVCTNIKKAILGPSLVFDEGAGNNIVGIVIYKIYFKYEQSSTLLYLGKLIPNVNNLP